MKLSDILKPIRIESNVIRNGKMYTQTWKGSTLLTETEVKGVHGGFTGLNTNVQGVYVPTRKRTDLNDGSNKPATLI